MEERTGNRAASESVGTTMVEGLFFMRLRKNEVYSEGSWKKENSGMGSEIHKICIL
jgi:hypothetical protein